MIIAVNFQFKQLERRSLKKRSRGHGSNPVEALIFFFQASSFQLLKLEIYCDDHSSLWSTTAVQVYELFHIYFTSLNNCDVKWLRFCYTTKALCLITKGQPRHVKIIQDGGAQEIWKQKYAILKFVFLHYRHSSEKKKLKLPLLQILYRPI